MYCSTEPCSTTIHLMVSFITCVGALHQFSTFYNARVLSPEMHHECSSSQQHLTS
eukprot:m.203412 g.203412  ORF g.203412 m.203412 type:complete len:55 (-) comp17072_c0_seq1:1050-1214(-)